MSWPNLKALVKRERRRVDSHMRDLLHGQPFVEAHEMLRRVEKCGCAWCVPIGAHLREVHGVKAPEQARAN